MEIPKLIEICCKCGFVHRDDRHSKPLHKQKKLHYHWMPKNNEIVKNNFLLHATICASCVNSSRIVNWKLYNEQRKITPLKYYLPMSYNAGLPSKYKYEFDAMYYDQATHFEVEF